MPTSGANIATSHPSSANAVNIRVPPMAHWSVSAVVIHALERGTAVPGMERSSSVDIPGTPRTRQAEDYQVGQARNGSA